ncbi:TlpA family protein disulfide reductase [Pseudogulbenkiania subflava]|uniref:Thiol-disulfide isomerase or thioredoxin n=1 Tax=Pseudogulbenkiania subflava DSM 22618 TaxID=1123014 RepID=A0A1Y6B4R5_9NEIS|nr:TlpA disulfide reductase family protein [Pseudogulbenkiania subflava]SME91932.1 Thiol-disulfide isomerase or thioredoxin [Pseudogulbenkiania subflava DSM 22618]
MTPTTLRRGVLPLLCAVLLTALPAAASPALERARFIDLAGRNAALTQYKGKVTVVNFWATWCSPCREEMPMLNAVRTRLAPRGVEVVGVALDDKVSVGNYLRSTRVSYPIVLGDGNTLDLMRAIGNPAGGLPYTVVLDRSGKQVATLIGKLSEQTLLQAVEPHL